MNCIFPEKGFWSGKKVFLTGHTGFKGSWMSIWLQTLGVEVLGFALEPATSPSLYNEAKVGEGMVSIFGDVSDLHSVRSSMESFSPEIVIHMAAQPLVRYSYNEPVETYSTNVMGTVNILESSRHCDSVKAIVNVTSDKCYENKERLWGYREDEAMGGYDPYSSSKGCSELVTSAYRNSFFKNSKVALASARAGNVIGGGDWADDRLVPDALLALQRGLPISVRNPNSIRPWQHVLEPLAGYLILAQKLFESGGEFAEAWNFGPQDEDAKTVSWMVSKLVTCWSQDASWIPAAGDHPHEANFLKLDISKATARLNWRPQWNLDECVSRTVVWHKLWFEKTSARQLCLNEINEFSRMEE